MDTSNLYYTTNNNLLISDKTLEGFNNIIERNNIFNKILNYIISYWFIFVILIIVIILYLLYVRNKENFYVDTKDAEENMANKFVRPTFNPYHSINDNQNYSHMLMDNYNSDGINYKNMEFLGVNDVEDNYYYINNNHPIINTQPTYNIDENKKLSDNNYTDYKKVNKENIDDLVKITFKKV